MLQCKVFNAPRNMSERADDGLDNGERAHLDWMFENQPQLVRELQRERKLGEHLDRKIQQALCLAEKLTLERAKSEDEAFVRGQARCR